MSIAVIVFMVLSLCCGAKFVESNEVTGLPDLLNKINETLVCEYCKALVTAFDEYGLRPEYSSPPPTVTPPTTTSSTGSSPTSTDRTATPPTGHPPTVSSSTGSSPTSTGPTTTPPTTTSTTGPPPPNRNGDEPNLAKNLQNGFQKLCPQMTADSPDAQFCKVLEKKGTDKTVRIHTFTQSYMKHQISKDKSDPCKEAEFCK
ncbi:hypothetical protein DdX_11810 [Ditylenchus destructor]|uniref:Uncharacterized protein n=1 Tax=Ditylenchus destructor TaxID=166010 RepID=A0AAD4MXE3_9BILA|nr:hypothetical protein DdX_11810 [Ditylenchus destructor]